MTRNHLAEISGFVGTLRFEDLPAEVVERIKFSVLDTIGCGVHGSLTPWGGIIGDTAAATAGDGVLWGRSDTADPANAAMANATMAHSFELDDLHMPSRSHPGGVTIPVAMALGQELGGIGGRHMIAAVAAGYEVTMRVGMAQGVSSFDRGWHPTGTAGCLGSAATAAHILGLDAAGVQHSLGIAGTMPCGLMAAQYGAMVKRLYAGHAAHAGLLAGRLAQRGFTGIPDIFDAEFGGYLKALSDDIHYECLADDLGKRYRTTELGYKFYSCVGASHTSLDATRRILDREPVGADDIAGIRVVTSEYQRTHAGWPYEPGTVMAAQMSIQFCVASMVRFRQVFVEQFARERLTDPETIALARRIAVESDPAQDALDRKSRVEITLRDGRTLSETSEFAVGHPRNPASWQDIAGKFMQLAGQVLPEERCRRIAGAVETLEDCADLRDLSDMLRLT